MESDIDDMMIESLNVNKTIEMYEMLASETLDVDSPAFHLLKAVRYELIVNQEMIRQYCDQFLARATFEINVELSEHQLNRLTDAVVALAGNLYIFYRETIHFRDDAIALLGDRFVFIIDEE